MQFRENLVRKREFGDSGPHEQWHHRIVTDALIVSNNDEMPEQPGRRPTSSAPAEEPKARGANRSTKVAGKLKVLPEQADLIAAPSAVARAASTGSDEDADADVEEEDDEEQVDADDVEVRVQITQEALFTDRSA